MVNEVIDYAKKKGKRGFIFKIDFEKAYDSVNWSFLDYMLARLGFGENGDLGLRLVFAPVPLQCLSMAAQQENLNRKGA